MTSRYPVRHGLTLVEIMMSVLVLSIGLLGVLAAIPFGGFQLAAMRDADYSSAVARNAFCAIRNNNWHVLNNNMYLSNLDQNLTMWGTQQLLSGGIAHWDSNVLYADLTLPIMIDPIAWDQPSTVANRYYFPYSIPSTVNTVELLRVIWPNFYYNGSSVVMTPEGIRYFFETHDDLTFGSTDAERVDGLRPVIKNDLAGSSSSVYPQTESTNFTYKINTGTSVNLSASLPTAPTWKASYDGQYNWFAMLRCAPRTEPFYDCPISPNSDIHKVDVDVAVCKGGRSKADQPSVFNVVLNGTGYQGGAFEVAGLDDTQIANLKDTLKDTKWVMLVGDEDRPQQNGSGANLQWLYRKYARWYKIASYSFVGTSLHLSLLGPDCPVRWSIDNENSRWTTPARTDVNHTTTVKLVVYPYVNAVYTQTFSLGH